MLKKIFLNFKRYACKKYIKICSLFSADYEYWHGAKEYYYHRTGKILDYSNPKDFNEKLMWLTRYWQHPLVAQCADKYRVRKYVESCGLNQILVPLYGVWDRVEDIDFDSLPNQFVLKCTHGCGYNVICKNKLHLDLEDTRQKLNTWMKEDYGRLFFEHHYSFIQPKIICEKFLPSISVSVTDYKIHCINGEPICFFVCTDRDNNHGGHVTYASYSTDWEKLDWLKKEPSEILPKPECLKMMVEYAKILSKPFPYVRVDFYEIERCVIFGEMTFTPYGNILDYYKDAVIVEFGKKLKLPQIYKKEQ